MHVVLRVCPAARKHCSRDEYPNWADVAKDSFLIYAIDDTVQHLPLEYVQNYCLVDHRHHDKASAFLQLADVRCFHADHGNYDAVGI
eukprot:CAMPEP_0206522670 /NCGR_PEP_ID=MMETSP0324_2-20121206/67119_1 /ASSEMBLY_ACC=CAM_ASM_000836 /TAXON_ID=2866 /ORGANISM="Crypthecodinium cohnii, Strain Seligo" /LENGTH=86 /DNA_ID=CAMNT_0054016875 /DNA_START=172 /DNA_END=432 /DNA_ORIENTATION=+